MAIESFDSAPKLEITNQKTEKSGGIVGKIKSIARNRMLAGALMGTLAATAVTGCDDKSQQDAAPMCETLEEFYVTGLFVEPKLNNDGTCTNFIFHYNNTLSQSVKINFVATHLKENGEIGKFEFPWILKPGYHDPPIMFEEKDGVTDAIVLEILNPTTDNGLDCEPIAYYNLQPDKRREYLTTPSSK